MNKSILTEQLVNDGLFFFFALSESSAKSLIIILKIPFLICF